MQTTPPPPPRPAKAALYGHRSLIVWPLLVVVAFFGTLLGAELSGGALLWFAGVAASVALVVPLSSVVVRILEARRIPGCRARPGRVAVSVAVRLVSAAGITALLVLALGNMSSDALAWRHAPVVEVSLDGTCTVSDGGGDCDDATWTANAMPHKGKLHVDDSDSIQGHGIGMTHVASVQAKVLGNEARLPKDVHITEVAKWDVSALWYWVAVVAMLLPFAVRVPWDPEAHRAARQARQEPAGGGAPARG